MKNPVLVAYYVAQANSLLEEIQGWQTTKADMDDPQWRRDHDISDDAIEGLKDDADAEIEEAAAKRAIALQTLAALNKDEPDFDGNPCQKTGGWVFLADRHEWMYGDLYRTPSGSMILRVLNDVPSNVRHSHPDDGKIWATFFRTFLDWSDTRMRTLVAEGDQHFAHVREGHKIVVKALD